MGEEQLLKSINKRLALLIKVNIQEELEGRSRSEQVELLEELDFRKKDIIEVLGISDNNYQTIKSRMD